MCHIFIVNVNLLRSLSVKQSGDDADRPGDHLLRLSLLQSPQAPVGRLQVFLTSRSFNEIFGLNHLETTGLWLQVIS